MKRQSCVMKNFFFVAGQKNVCRSAMDDAPEELLLSGEKPRGYSEQGKAMLSYTLDLFFCNRSFRFANILSLQNQDVFYLTLTLYS